MKWSSRVFLLATLTAIGAGSLFAAAPASQAAAEARLRAAAGDSLAVTYSRRTGAASFVRAQAADVDLAAGLTGSDELRARAFFATYSGLFGIRDAASELDLVSRRKDNLGDTHLTFQQIHRGVPVFAGLVRAHFDGAGRLRSINGGFVPGLDLGTRARLDSDAARRAAIDAVDNAVIAGSGPLSTDLPRLVVYSPRLVEADLPDARLAWYVEVRDGGQIHEYAFIDAATGKVVDRLPGVMDAMSRRGYPGFDGNGDNIPDAWPAAPTWVEGNPLPSGIQEQDNMLYASGDVYSVFAILGYDSYDNNGSFMDAAYERNYGCPNASWNGVFISFCPGFTTHDVTAHEWGHAYTQFTDGLIYRWQSGALSEAYSDIWGEALDQKRTLAGMVDTDTPDAPRTTGNCSIATVLPHLVVNAPPAIAGNYTTGYALFGPHVNSPITQDIVLVVDSNAGTDTDPNNACSPITNVAQVAGKIAFVNRGGVAPPLANCPFSVKVRNAQAAGAVAVIVGNIASSPTPTSPPNMSCADVCSDILIPAVSVNLADADALRAQFPSATVNGTIEPNSTGSEDVSVRWLMGEDVEGGALRDMYNPGCFSNPAKVSDASYVCSSGDNGGVHSNSGVPNHAFALLVDGGTYNGQTVTGIGMSKAAYIYWRSQSVYLFPAADFVDHADALEASCADLVGQTLPDPWTGQPVVFAQADCNEIPLALAAVEMRTPPSCGFLPMLDPNAPALCGTQFAYSVAGSDFETDAGGFTFSRRAVADPGTFDPRDWTRETPLPGGRTGSAFHAPDPNTGDCVTDLEAGVLVLDSPVLTMPSGGQQPRFAFDHYMASELNYDGGNLKISVNGGAFSVVPGTAYSFNPYVGNLVASDDPLAGEAAFHGANQGSNSGSWGRSILDLSSLVAAGQTFQLRFEMGTDGCGGTELGWWVDDANVFVCTAQQALFLDGFEVGDSTRWSAVTP